MRLMRMVGGPGDGRVHDLHTLKREADARTGEALALPENIGKAEYHLTGYVDARTGHELCVYYGLLDALADGSVALAMNPMTEARAREILAGSVDGCDTKALLGGDLVWSPGQPTAYLGGRFTPDELEAIAFWMRLHAKP